MIQIQNLSKSFHKNQVLSSLDLEISQPGVFAVLGPNGSGKTTLIKCILGMVIPDSGQIRYQGASITNEWKYRAAISYLPQIARFPENLTVNELLQMIRDIRDQAARAEEIIHLFGLEPWLNSRLGTLSGGTRQKVNLVLAFMYDNPVIIMDEPTAGLDPVALIRLKDLIQAERQKGKIILVTTHVMNFVEEMANEIVFLLDGRIRFRGELAALKRRCGEPTLERAIAKLLQGECLEAGPAAGKTAAENPDKGFFQPKTEIPCSRY